MEYTYIALSCHNMEIGIFDFELQISF